jgi:predicted MPP superfamily phosphohydrolase
MWRIVAIGAAWTALWWLIIGGLLAPLVPGGWLTILAAALAAIAPLLVLVQRVRGAYPSAGVRLFVFRPFWYVQLAAPLIAIAGMVGVLLGAIFSAPVAGGRWAMLIAGTTLALAAALGYIGSRRLLVKELEARFPDLPTSLDGLRVAQVSDLHVGPHTSRRHLARVSRAVQRARPDLIAITGDQVDDFGGDAAYFAAAFGGLTAPHGLFAVAGNHDVYAGWAAVRAGLDGMGVLVLVNEAVEIRHGSDSFWVAGTGDPAGSGRRSGEGGEAAPDITRTLASIPPGAFVIALAHNPLLWPALAERGVPLTLSGHTHHGQLALPRMGWSLASLFLEHAMGWHRRGPSLLYINPGTNHWGLPLRIGALPEVTVLTMRRMPGGQPEIVAHER